MAINWLDDLNPMSDPGEAAGGLEMRVAVDDQGHRSAVLVPVGFGRLTQEGTEATAFLQKAALAVRAAQDQLEFAVMASREVGVSWSLIGWSAGITGQAAHKHWGEAGQARYREID